MKRYHDNKNTERWFITGATGFVGREFIWHLLEQGVPATKISVLVRCGHANSAKDRFISSLSDLVTETELRKIKVIDGDITQRFFGLDRSCWEALTASTHIVHMAALTNFDAELEVARQYNVEGVKNVIELASAARKNGNLNRWAHVSTAYVVGSRTDTVHPEELNYGHGFRNTYEQSKNEAEQLLNPLFSEFPLTIFRPSIIMGHSKTGKAGNFNTVYWAIRNYLSGHTRVYAKADAPLDLVPVDYVVKAIFKLLSNRSTIGKTIVLAGGDNTTVSLYEFADQICRYLDSPLPEIVDPVKLKRMRLFLTAAKVSKRHRQFIKQAESYLPYFTQNPRFDTSETERLLANSSIFVPPLHDYIGNILDYCLRQNWGRRSKIVGQGYQMQKAANG